MAALYDAHNVPAWDAVTTSSPPKACTEGAILPVRDESPGLESASPPARGKTWHFSTYNTAPDRRPLPVLLAIRSPPCIENLVPKTQT